MLSIKTVVGLLLICLCFNSIASAQTQTGSISGTIIAADDKPLSGATISIMGVAKTQSDKNGAFTLPAVPEGTVSLQITNIGKIRINTQVTVKAGLTTQVNYAMDDDVKALKEVTIGSKSISLKFTDIANLPAALSNTTFVTDDRYIYAINGRVSTGALDKAVLKYDPASNTWSVLTQRLTPKMDVSAAYAPSTNKIYVIGGLNTSNEINQSTESVDVGTGEVKKIKVTNPMPSMAGGSAVWDNQIYFFGGSRFRLETKPLEGIVSTGASYNSLYRFEPETEKFTELADMPYAAEISGAIVDGVLYTFGGYDPFQHKAFNFISAYNIATNTWQSLGKLPVNVSATDVAVFGNKIFIVGNYDDDTFLGYYDTSNNTFTKVKSNLKPRKHAAAGIIGGRYLVAFGGASRITNRYVSAQMIDLQSVFGE